MASTKQIVKNCGNFSEKVLPGMIAYGQETERGRGKLDAASAPLPSGGYITSEADILVGGFLHIRCCQEAAANNHVFSELSLKEKRDLALKVSRDHIADYGNVSHEYYQHWLKRVQNFAKHQNLSLPEQRGSETPFDYFRRLHRWTLEWPEHHLPQNGVTPNWPKLQPAVGTHLVFSPAPGIWDVLRGKGVNERAFLRSVVAQTMKEFQDWRRKQFGPGHSLGWVAGTHVDKSDAATRHPHAHIMVLKRDQSGREVDWSVSVLKGHKALKENQPDPLQEIKRLFTKNVEKAFERTTQKTIQNAISNGQDKIKTPAPLLSPRLSRLREGMRRAAKIMLPFHPRGFTRARGGGEFGAMLRLAAQVSANRHISRQFQLQPD